MIKAILFLGVVLAANVFLIWSGWITYIEDMVPFAPARDAIEAEVVDVFMFTLNDEVVKSDLIEVDGLTPDAYLLVLPGLVANDFDGVRSQVGVYEYAEGQLVHVKDDGRLINEASFVVTSRGMEQLLNNVLDRTGLNLEDNTITEVLNVVVNESNTR